MAFLDLYRWFLPSRSRLTIAPDRAAGHSNKKVGDSTAITVTGGTSPYKFELSFGSGTLTQNIFKTPAEGYATLKVTDADSNSQYFSIFTGTVSGTGGYSGGVPQYQMAPVHRFYKALTGEHLYTLS